MRSGARDAEGGSGYVGTTAGVGAFLLLLLFAVQLLANLYATTTISAAGLDAARIVASKEVDHTDPGSVSSARVRAEARFRSLLGRVGDRASLTWADDLDVVRLRVIVDTPMILPRALGTVVAFGRVDRTFEVHVEELR